MTPINDNFRQLIDWYGEMGISVALQEAPLNHFSWKPQAKSMTPSLQATGTPFRTGAPQSFSSQPAQDTPMPPKPKISSQTRDIANACQTLDELRQAMLNFNGCDLKLTATNLVFADGNPQAKIMVVGEAPGADEDRQGLPFVGLSGQLLDKAFGAIGLDRTKIYISNIIPWRPPGNRQPTTQEIALCQPFIERHIELIQPKILVLVGGVSTKTILNTNEGIMKLRGKWLDYQTPALSAPIKTLATYHPAFLLRSPGQKAMVWRDMLTLEDEVSQWKDDDRKKSNS